MDHCAFRWNTMRDKRTRHERGRLKQTLHAREELYIHYSKSNEIPVKELYLTLLGRMFFMIWKENFQMGAASFCTERAFLLPFWNLTMLILVCFQNPQSTTYAKCYVKEYPISQSMYIPNVELEVCTLRQKKS